MINRQKSIISSILIVFYLVCILIPYFSLFQFRNGNIEDKFNENSYQNNPKLSEIRVPIFIGNISLVYEWNRTAITMDNGLNDYGVDAVVDKNDNIYNLGLKDYPHNEKLYLEKYNKEGGLLWNRTWDGGLSELRAGGICINKYNDIFITGYYTDQAGTPNVNHNIFLIKYDEGGNFLWLRTWGLTGFDIRDIGNDVSCDSLGDVYIVGESDSYTPSVDIILIKYDRNGNFKWYKTWGGTIIDNGYTIEIDDYDNIYITGWIYISSYYRQMCLLKYDTSGTLLWANTWGGNDIDEGKGVAVDSNNNIYVIGYSDSLITHNDYAFMVKYNSNGQEQWNITFDDSVVTRFLKILIDSLDNIYIIGAGTFFGTYYCFNLLKYNSLGKIVEYGCLTHWIAEKKWVGLDIDSENSIYTTGWYAFGEFGTFCLVKFRVDPDTDSDGLSDWREINVYFTDPNNPDTDGDGYNDGFEVDNGYDPLDPNDPQQDESPDEPPDEPSDEPPDEPSDEPQDQQPSISGYNMVLLLFCLPLVVLITYKKYEKSKNR